MRHIGQKYGKPKPVKQDTEHLNIHCIGISELKYTKLAHFCQYFIQEMTKNRNNKMKRNAVALMLRQDVTQAV